MRLRAPLLPKISFLIGVIMKIKSVFRVMIFITAMISICLALSLSASAESADVSHAAEDIAAAVDKCQTEVDLTKYRLSPDELAAAMREVLYTCPELFYLAETWQYYSDSASCVTRVLLEYRYPVKDIPAKRTEYAALLSDFIAKCGIDESSSDFECVLAAHDTMITLYSYDSDLITDTAYGMLTNGKGVCEAYSLLFLEVMRYCEIESFIALNIPEKHCWNMVKLGGKWYHLDLTWDDPTTTARGVVNHNYFLINDSELAALNADGGGHASWTPTVKATGSAYNFEALRSHSYPFCLVDGKWYSIDREKAAICVYDVSDFSAKAIYTIKDKWYVLGKEESYWKGCLSGFGAFDGRLYFNTPTKLVTINTKGKDKKTLTPSLDGENIYDMEIVGDTLIYYVATSPNEEKRAVRVRLYPEREETTVPETTVPETTVPETTVPETTVSETTVPETTIPETTVPETTTPESTPDSTKAPTDTTGRTGDEAFGCKMSVCVTLIPALVALGACLIKRKE